MPRALRAASLLLVGSALVLASGGEVLRLKPACSRIVHKQRGQK